MYSEREVDFESATAAAFALCNISEANLIRFCVLVSAACAYGD